MRRVSWKALASLWIAIMAILVVLPTAAFAHAAPPAASGAAPAVVPGATHTAGVTPSVGFTATPAFNLVSTPIPATASAPFLLAWTVTYTGVNFSVNASGFAGNTTFDLLALNGTSAATATMIADMSIAPSSVAFGQTGATSWVGTGISTVDGAFLTSGGVPLNYSAKLFFELNTTAFLATPENSTGSTGVQGTGTTIPVVTGSITGVTPPAANSPVPFNVNYTVTTANTGGISSANTNVQVAIGWNSSGTVEPVTAIAATWQVVAAGVGASSQSFSVNYLNLTSLNFHNGNIPSGSYRINVTFNVTNGLGANAGPLGWKLWSGVTFVNSTATLTTFGVNVTSSGLMAVQQPFPWTLNWNVSAPALSTVNQTITIVDTTVGLPAGLVNTFTPIYHPDAAQTLTLTAKDVCSMNYSGCNVSLYNFPITDHFVVTVTATVTSAGGIRSADTFSGGFFIPVGLNGSAKAAQQAYGGVVGGIGNVTLFAWYNGSSITQANLIVRAPNGAIALTASVLTSLPGPKTGKANWVPTAAGNYTVTLFLNNSAGQTYTTTAITVPVIATGGAVVTKNYWNNATLIPGLSTAASAALLLVIGLVVGMVVAFLLARMMWARPKQEPAQPWKSETGTHECSVCHQTFATEDELKEHQKTAHGIQ